MLNALVDMADSVLLLKCVDDEDDETVERSTSNRLGINMWNHFCMYTFTQVVTCTLVYKNNYSTDYARQLKGL